MVATLELALLGHPELRLAGQPLPKLRSVKVYALLYYLAVTRRTQARTVLTGLFWGDGDEYYARRNFNRALSDLAQFLGDYLVIERQSVAFAHQQPHWLDVAVLENAAATLPTAQNVTPLTAAANLYRGDFLDGFALQEAPEFDQWLLGERLPALSCQGEALINLGAVASSERRYTDAHAYYRQALALAQALGYQPRVERISTNMGTLYFRQQAYQEALATYEQALQMAQAEGDQTFVMINTSNIGGVQRVAGQYQATRNTYQRSLVMARNLGMTGHHLGRQSNVR